jgi:ribosomal-protein-alanine N-acetyltransferase
MYPVEVRSTRLLLREWRSDEVLALHRWLADPVVTRYLSWATSTIDESRAHLDEILAEQQAVRRRKYFLALELLTAPGATIGDVGFTWIGHQTAEIGYFLEPSFWGRGYASEAVASVFDLIVELGGSAALASCDAENVASENVMKASGMTLSDSPESGRLLYRINLAAEGGSRVD